MDPASAVRLEPHDGGTGHRLCEQARLGTKIGIDAQVEEPSAPPPLAARFERLRITTVVVVKERDAERRRRTPLEPPIEARPMIDFDERARLVLLQQTDERVEWWQRQMAEHRRLLVVERPAAERQ